MKVWEKSHTLVLAIYNVTANFPKEEMYNLTSQIRRAAVSIPGNIAEGCGRGGDGEMKRFLQISMGSASELEYFLQLSYELKYLSETDYAALSEGVIEIKKMLAPFIHKLTIEKYQRIEA